MKKTTSFRVGAVTAAMAAVMLWSSPVRAQSPTPADPDDHAGHDHSGHVHADPYLQPPPRREGPAGKIVLEKTVIDFGKILDTAEVNGQVMISNPGPGPLTIQTVSTSCGCTVGSIGDRELKPGEGTNLNFVIEPGKSAPLKVKFNPHGKSNSISQRVTILSDDPQTPTTGLDVRAFINPLIKIEPVMVDLGMLRKGEIGTTFVSVIARSPDFQATGVTATVGNGEWLTAQIIDARDETEDGDPVKRVEIELSWDGEGKPGPIRGMITLSTNDPARQTVNASVIGTILGDVAVNPERIMLGMMNPGAPLQKTIRVSHRDGKPFEVTGLEESSNNEKKIEWKAMPVDPLKKDAYDVTLTVTGNTKAGAIRGSLTLNTNVPDEEKINIVFYGVVSTPTEVGLTPGPGR